MPSTPDSYAQRTALAWQRSALALAVLGALFLHGGRILGIIAGALLIASAAAAYESARHAGERPQRLRALSALTFVAALAAALTVLGA
jgi:uncharacterized membrane protein YidH (DUF202 family)